jgi:hypothetical protein
MRSGRIPFSLGSLLDLFLTVDEFYARYDFGEQFRAVEPAPVLFDLQAQFNDPWSVLRFAIRILWFDGFAAGR